MKICVLGNGLLANEFKNYGYDVIEYNFNEIIVEDLINYDIVINTYNYQGDDMNKILDCNVNLPLLLSNYCTTNKKRYVHISTADLYYGSAVILGHEDDVIYGTDAYLASKVLGESVCNKKALIIRTHNLFNNEPENENALFSAIINSTPTKNSESYTWTVDAIRSIIDLLKRKKHGIFNVASRGYLSQADICTQVCIQDMAPTTDEISGIYVKMDTKKLQENFIPTKAVDNIVQCFNELKEKLGE